MSQPKLEEATSHHVVAPKRAINGVFTYRVIAKYPGGHGDEITFTIPEAEIVNGDLLLSKCADAERRLKKINAKRNNIKL